MANLILVLGGVRSGKSRFAQQLAQQLGGDEVLFIATAAVGDAEMSRRIQIHRASRPANWQTLEAAQDVGHALQQTHAMPPTILIDCLTLLVSNVLLSCGEDPDPDLAERRVNAEISSLLSACDQRQGTVILVSGEVGMGVVPEFSLGRLYRDLLGWTNQAVAARSLAAYLMVAGLAVELKTLACSVEQAALMVETPRFAIEKQ
jgi:adenosylcobinamide kinase/adenosylcobinamide-phosphate guanylyltransferase